MEHTTSPPTFILSFDCEGKWGLADQISEYHTKTITNENLIATYSRLADILEKYNVVATFAFVGAFMMSVEDFYQNEEWFQPIRTRDGNWLSRFQSAKDKDQFDGWFAPECLQIIRNSHMDHEIGLHGFSHVPLSEDLIDLRTFQQEMELGLKCSAMFGETVKTLVYPRNLIGYVDHLSNYGYLGFRDALGTKAKARKLLDELNLRQNSHPHAHAASGVCKIPGGYFLNWRKGIRSWVPSFVTHARWKNILNDAVNHSGVAHMWIHPHNFIDGNEQFELFEQIIKLASAHIHQGRIVNLTQSSYCEKASIVNGL